MTKRSFSLKLSDNPCCSPSGGGSCDWRGLWGEITSGDIVDESGREGRETHLVKLAKYPIS